jgi:2,3-bisphosphoglycerate-dependent phosphoglycerate mutase
MKVYVPMLYELDERIQPMSRRFLGDPAVLAAAQDAVRRQTEKK